MFIVCATKANAFDYTLFRVISRRYATEKSCVLEGKSYPRVSHRLTEAIARQVRQANSAP